MKPVIIRTGARVTRIDEEGYVGLFLYSHDATFSFKVADGTVKAWAGRLGDFVTIIIEDGKHVYTEEVPAPLASNPTDRSNGQ